MMDQRGGRAGLSNAERKRLESRVLEQIRALRARIDPAVLPPTADPREPVPPDRRAVETAVALYLAGRKDGGRMMRDVFTELERHSAPEEATRRPKVGTDSPGYSDPPYGRTQR